MILAAARKNMQPMNKLLLLLIVALPLYGFGQANKFLTNVDLEKIYSQAIGDFIQDVNKNKRITLDTLFFRKRTNEEEPTDNFPDIKLPESIANVYIRLIPPEIGDVQQKKLKYRIYINMLGRIDNQKIKFDFFVFSNGFEYKFNYRIDYDYNSQLKKFELIKLQFQEPHSK